ncbi:hypothetical protein [Ferruginibacter sp.]
MGYKEELEEMHQRSLLKVEHFINKKAEEEDHEKLHQLKKEWDVAWAKLMETLLVLERIEI